MNRNNKKIIDPPSVEPLGDFCYAEGMRKTTFANEQYYHIYNRGVDKREVFLDEVDYERFLLCLREFNRQEAVGSLYEQSFKKVEHLGTKSLRIFGCYLLSELYNRSNKSKF